MKRPLIAGFVFLALAGQSVGATFTLKHASGKTYGPYQYENGAEVAIGKVRFSLLKVEGAKPAVIFRYETGKTYGPFPYEQGAKVSMGKVAFSLQIQQPAKPPPAQPVKKPAAPAKAPPTTAPATAPAAAPAVAPAKAAGKRTIFIAPFENASGQDQYDPAAAGMGDLVGVFLAEQENIDVAERQQLRLLEAEQERSLLGLTGEKYAIAAGRILKADTVLAGRMFLIQNKLTVNVKALEIETARVVATEQLSCRPEYMIEAALQLASKLAKQMKMPLPPIDMKEIDKSPAAGLHFAKGLSSYYAGNMNDALMHLMRTVDLDPNFVESHYWSAMCYYRLKEYRHAAIDFERFLKDDPKSGRAVEAKKLLQKSENLMNEPRSVTIRKGK